MESSDKSYRQQSLDWIPLDAWADDARRAELDRIWSAPKLSKVKSALFEVGLQPLLVGGVVRDLLLGRPNKDIDLVIDCSARKLMKMGVRLGKLTEGTPVPLDRERGILRLCFPDADELDLVALQGETAWDDLARRDLRVNAMAVNSSGELADPWDGRKDLEQKVLRGIRGENFQEDPLRVVRALRFSAQLDSILDPQTLQHAVAAVGGLEHVAGERISAELEKFFPFASAAHIRTFREMGISELLLPKKEWRWSLLQHAVESGAVSYPSALAVLIGPGTEPKRCNELFSRLKLSRKDQNYLTHWWSGAAHLENLEKLGLGDIYDISVLSGPAFGDLAETAFLTEYPTTLSAEARQLLHKESQGQGQLRWSEPPWSGGALSVEFDKPGGPWLGKAVRLLRKAWALREVENLSEAVVFLKKRGAGLF